MEHKLITYRTKPERAAENERLIRGVFDELRAAAPDGVRYTVLKLDDDTFVHFVESDENGFSVPSLAAFKRFQDGSAERRTDVPQTRVANVVGNYRMLAD